MKPGKSIQAHLNSAHLPLDKATYTAQLKANKAENYTAPTVNCGKGEGKSSSKQMIQPPIYSKVKDCLVHLNAS